MCCASYKPYMAGTELVPAQLCFLRQPLTTSWQKHNPASGVVSVPGELASTIMHTVNQTLLQSRQTYARKGLHRNPSQSDNPHYRVSFSHQLPVGFFKKECGWAQPTMSFYKSSHFKAVSLQATTISLLHHGTVFSFYLNIPLRNSLFHLYHDNRVSLPP